MSLYKLKAHRTKVYDRSSECTVIISERGWLRDVDKWITGYLLQYPDGKVTVIDLGRPNKRKNHQRKVKTVTLTGATYP